MTDSAGENEAAADSRPELTPAREVESDSVPKAESAIEAMERQLEPLRAARRELEPVPQRSALKVDEVGASATTETPRVDVAAEPEGESVIHEHLEDMRAQNAQLLLQIEELKRQQAIVGKRAETANRSRASLEAEAERLADALTREAATAKEAQSRLQTELDELSRERNLAEETANELASELEQRGDAVDELRQAQIEAQSQAAREQAEVVARLEFAAGQIRGLKQKLNDADKASKIAQARIDELLADRARLEVEARALRSDAVSFEQREQQMHEQLAEKAEALASAHGTAKAHASALADMTDERDSWREQLHSATEQLHSATEQLHSATEQLAQAQHQAMQTTAASDEMQRRIDELIAERAELDAQGHNPAELEELRHERDQLNAELALLSSANEEIAILRSELRAAKRQATEGRESTMAQVPRGMPPDEDSSPGSVRPSAAFAERSKVSGSGGYSIISVPSKKRRKD